MKQKEHIKLLLDRWRLEPQTNHDGNQQRKSLWKVLYSYWMKFALLLGKVSTAILLTLFYVFVVGPVAIAFKLFGKDLLDRKAEHRASYWYDKSKEPITLDQSKHQF